MTVTVEAGLPSYFFGATPYHLQGGNLIINTGGTAGQWANPDVSPGYWTAPPPYSGIPHVPQAQPWPQPAQWPRPMVPGWPFAPEPREEPRRASPDDDKVQDMIERLMKLRREDLEPVEEPVEEPQKKGSFKPSRKLNL